MTVSNYIECMPVNHKSQLEAVKNVMFSHGWVTKYYIAGLLCMELSSVASRLRDLRLEKYGGYIIERRKTSEKGVYEYRLSIPNIKQGKLF